MFNIFIFPLA